MRPQTVQDIIEGVALGVILGSLILGLFWLLQRVLV